MIIYELESDYAHYLEALGAPRRLVRKYAFRNAMLPQISGLALSLGAIIAGALVTEIVFSYPGLDKIGNAGANDYFGPKFFNDDLALTKAFTIHENIATNFRMDAFNAFNHINPGNPNNGDVFGTGPISGQAPGANTRYLEFSLRVQF